MKKITFFAAVVAVLLSSCSKNEVTSVVPSGDNVDHIGINTGVGISKGVDMVGSSLQSHEIVLSYIDSEATPKVGTLTFEYDNAENEWSDNTAGVKWSALTLPATFFSFCDAGGDIAVANGYGATASLASDYVVSSNDPTKHADLLYMTEKVSAVPVAGKIYSTFKHALSKVDLVAKVGENGVKANYVSFNNLKSSGVATITSGYTNSSLVWAPGSTTNFYESLNRKRALTEPADTKVLAKDAIISNDTKDQSADANMKLIPQTIGAHYLTLQAAIKAEVDGTTVKSLTDVDYSAFQYVEVQYRMTGSQGERIVGFEDASNYPGFKDWSEEDKLKYGGKPFFVKAAFVLSNELLLKPSSYYKLNLNFNSFGGLLMDDKYYDQNGDRTNFDVVADVEPGEPIIPGDDTVIGITVVVDEWTTESDTDLQ